MQNLSRFFLSALHLNHAGPPFLCNLPEELILSIFSYLTIPDLKQCRLLNHRLKRVSEEPSLHQRSKIALKKIASSHFALNQLNFLEVRKRLPFIGGIDYGQLNRGQVQAFIPYMSRFQTLDLDVAFTWKREELEQLLAAFNEVRSLSVPAAKLGRGTLSAIAAKCPSLQHLNLNGKGEEKNELLLEALEDDHCHLTFRKKSVAPLFPSLTHLYLEYCEADGILLDFIAKNCPNLTFLSVSGNFLDQSQWRQLAISFNHLKELKACFCALDEKGVEALLEKCPTLSLLHLNFNQLSGENLAKRPFLKDRSGSLRFIC